MIWLMALAAYAGFLAFLLFGYWLYGVVADRIHARRTVAAFDRYVEALNREQEGK